MTTIRCPVQIDAPDGEYRGEWEGKVVTVQFPEWDETIPVNYATSKVLDVVVVVVGGYMVAETLQNVEIG